MEKFETILAKFINNPYINIHDNQKNRKLFKEIILYSFLFIPFLITLSFGIGTITIHNKLNNYFIYEIFYYTYLFLWIALIIMIYFFTIAYYFSIKYKILIKSYYTSYLITITLITILVFPLSFLFIIDNIQPTTICAYYLTFIFFIIFYGVYYFRKWKYYIFKNHYEKLKNRLKAVDYYFDTNDNNLFQNLNLKEEEKDKPKLTKIAGIFVSLMMRFGFSIPLLATLASNGVGENSMIYFVIYLMLFIIPMIMKIVSQFISIHYILKQIEKEENVTIYNGRKIDPKLNE